MTQTSEERKLVQKAYHVANREKINARRRKWSKDNPERVLANSKRYHIENKELVNAKSKLWREKNPERCLELHREWYAKNRKKAVINARHYNLKRKYGLSVEQFVAMAEAQDYKCANPACRTDNPGSNGSWNVDHDHKTDAVRGLLCWRCNITLGHVGDDEALLSGLIEYLRKHKDV